MKRKLGILGGIVIASMIGFILLKTTTIKLNVLKTDRKAEMIDAYLSKKRMPLAGYGLELVIAAERNNLDWRLLPAIAIRESSGGRNACGSNFFGWASCKRTFKTISEAIRVVAQHLGGNATTTKHFYAEKNTWGKLRSYNSEIKEYPNQVEAIMQDMSK